MNGRQAAKAVHDLCIEREHNRSPVNRDQFMLCERCRDVMNRLEQLGAEERPPLSTVTVHFAVDPLTGSVTARMDEVEAIAAATEVKGVVVSWPVSTDCRGGDRG